MNDAEIEWVEPGQLFEVMSSFRRGIISATVKEVQAFNESYFSLARAVSIPDEEFLMLVKTPETLDASLFDAVFDLMVVGYAWPESAPIYEFLWGEKTVYLYERQLHELEWVY